ncbi:MAG: potassium/proton antiporter [Ignavibacteria bacterium]|jgi:cell volume regulation protein A|nr:potassium/proton antiporter [Ignavibacteria bacterium]MCU7501249.1 potassium/proton antiporter [Ignavibacteria bacterium]MCU7513751.1 potassium/proton antiporter [Ignavibacteria bacterium]MCU7520936.1 potassium/proton antiporter [Ignavibacteria bacterium]MCU7524686.1 potassium/proton antiporter [Ignavibacteria bacterium]
MIPVEYYILISSILILISIGIARFSHNLGIPTLLLFIGIGMLAGSEGIGGIEFDNAYIAQTVGIIALIFILFSGGLGTDWTEVRPVLRDSLSLATLGVFLTAIITGLLAYMVLDLSLLACILIGSIVSSTDAAAVFAVLRSKNVSLKNRLKPLLELESGSNDPMAVFLTLGLIQLNLKPDTSLWNLLGLFLMQMGLGSVIGLASGRGIAFLINYLKVPYQGVYPVLLLASACFVYSATALLNGSGFLAVYIAGIVIGNQEIVHKKVLNRFFDSMAWLSQICVFLILGLLVFPSRLIKVTESGLLLSFFLIFIARPLSVFISMIFSKFSFREKLFISWVGLRGAVPIVLATFPLMYGVQGAGFFFSLVFFIVLTSALLQGWTINPMARLLKVDTPEVKVPQSPIEFSQVEGMDADLVDFYVFEGSKNVGKSLVELRLPHDSLVVLINRNENYIVPSGGTTIENGDILLILVSNENLNKVKEILSR